MHFFLIICPESKGLKDQQLSKAVDISEHLQKVLETPIQLLFQAEKASTRSCTSQEKTLATKREAVLGWDALGISLWLHSTLCNQTLTEAGVSLGLPFSKVGILAAYKKDHLLKADQVRQDKPRGACLNCRGCRSNLLCPNQRPKFANNPRLIKMDF